MLDMFQSLHNRIFPTRSGEGEDEHLDCVPALSSQEKRVSSAAAPAQLSRPNSSQQAPPSSREDLFVSAVRSCKPIVVIVFCILCCELML